MVDFLRTLRDEGASTNYLNNHRQTLAYILHANLTVADFDSNRLQEKFCEAHHAKNWATSTLEAHLVRLCTFGNYLCRSHVTNRRHRPPNRTRRAKQRDLPMPEELSKLITSLEERAKKRTLIKRRVYWERCALMVRVWIETGIRNQECLDIHVEDIAEHDGAYFLFVRGTKSDSAERSVKISESLALDCISFASRNDLTGLLFVSGTGKPLCRVTIGHWLKKYCAELGIHCSVTPQTFRYYYIVHQIASGLSALELMTRLGHSDVGMTVGYFNQVRRMMPWLPLAGDVALLEKRQQFWQRRSSLTNGGKK